MKKVHEHTFDFIVKRRNIYIYICSYPTCKEVMIYDAQGEIN